MGRTIGIDLGTTNSVVATLEGGEPVVIASADGRRTVPSIVAFAGDDVLIGEVARRQAVTNTAGTFRSTKRHMGTDWTREARGTVYTPQQIAAHVLTKLKEDAESYLGEPVTDAVITVPAYFSDAQRQATKDAGEIAGLNVTRIVNEPTAAALAYGLDAEEDQLVLVFDLGGGTFDVSLLQVTKDDDGFSTVQVKATSGDNQLGGDDWDEAVMDLLAGRFLDTHGVDLRLDDTARARLVEAAETAKISLSAAHETQVHLPYISVVDGSPVHLQDTVSRADFHKVTDELLQRCTGPIHQVIDDAAVSFEEIDHVVLVGGSTRMAAVVTLVTNLTGKEPHRGVNPDEVVALGAALQAGVLSGEVNDILLIDVTPLTLGIETRGGLLSPIIERNTAIPVRCTDIFTTGADNQSSVKIGVYQGERPLATDNVLLGHFKLTGLPPAPRGVPQIEVTFDIDANGIVHVDAMDTATRRRQSMVVSGSSSMTTEQIENLVASAATHREKDKARKDRAQSRVEAELALHNVDTFLSSGVVTLSAQLQADLDAAAGHLWETLDDASSDGLGIRQATLRFSDCAKRVGEELYAGLDAPTIAADLGTCPAGPAEVPVPEDGEEPLTEGEAEDVKVGAPTEGDEEEPEVDAHRPARDAADSQDHPA